MREALITCTCPSIRIPDLELTLSKGNVVHLDSEKAKASKDLTIAEKAFGVKVEYIGRCRSQRPGGGNALPRAPLAPKPTRAPAPPSPEPETLSNDGIDLDALAQRVADRLGRDVDAIRELLKGDIKALLLETIGGLALASPQAVGSGRVEAGPQEEPFPMFIPDGLVSEDSADIEVQQGTEEGSTVDEATTVLRRMKKKSS